MEHKNFTLDEKHLGYIVGAIKKQLHCGEVVQLNVRLCPPKVLLMQ